MSELLDPRRNSCFGNKKIKVPRHKGDRVVETAVARVEEKAKQQQVKRSHSDQRTGFRDVADAAKNMADLERVPNLPWFILDPRGDAVARWDTTTSFALIYVMQTAGM
jgi:hypothetical protein